MPSRRNDRILRCMRVAVLADIHANLPALEAILHDVDAAGVDAIVLPGDMTIGPLQADTLDLLSSLGERAIWVRGNCERNLVEVYDGTYQPTGGAHEPGVIWAGHQLTATQRDHLAALPLTVSVDVDGLGPVLFCHATARDDNEIVLVDSPLEWFAEGFARVTEQTWSAATPTCRSTGSPTAAASSTPAASACPTARRGRWPTGRCSAPRATPRRSRSSASGPQSAATTSLLEPG